MRATQTQEQQRRYYERTASEYDRMHVSAGDEHAEALSHIASTLGTIGAESVLDVGCGTGRGIKYLSEARPDLEIKGVEPVEALIDQAVATNGVPRDALVAGRGESLPFPDRRFDAAVAIGVLHHVPDPALVIAEMQRVARLAIFISDANRFGRGPLPTRLLKLGLAKAHLWKLAFRIRRLGRDYVVSEGDGVAYSYSVYDSLAQVSGWAEWVQLIGVEFESSESWFNPLLTSPTVLLAAGRDELPGAG
jgi:SAM-dependent methyltransferase